MKKMVVNEPTSSSDMSITLLNMIFRSNKTFTLSFQKNISTIKHRKEVIFLVNFSDQLPLHPIPHS